MKSFLKSPQSKMLFCLVGIKVGDVDLIDPFCSKAEEEDGVIGDGSSLCPIASSKLEMNLLIPILLFKGELA